MIVITLLPGIKLCANSNKLNVKGNDLSTNKVSADSNDLLGFGIATLRFSYSALPAKNTPLPKYNVRPGFGIDLSLSCTAA